MAKSESQHTRHVGGVVMPEPNRANSAHARQIYYQPLDVALLLRTHDGLYKTGYKIASIFINKILCSVEALYMYAILWCICYYWRYRKNIFFLNFCQTSVHSKTRYRLSNRMPKSSSKTSKDLWLR